MTIFNRFNPADPATQHESIDYHEDRFCQAAELNEGWAIQEAARKAALDQIWDDGEICDGCALAVDPVTGDAQADEGTLYLSGRVRTVTAAAFTVAVVGTVTVGVYLHRRRITHLDDATLYGLDKSLPFAHEPGADRTHVDLAWGLPGDGHAGDFFPVWEVNDGIVKPREVAQMTAITRALEIYDEQSTGGYYVNSGLTVTQLDDVSDELQAYMVAPGSARIRGVLVSIPVQRRIELQTLRDLFTVEAEPTLSTTAVGMPVEFDRLPVVGVPAVQITARKTAPIIHTMAGGADKIDDEGVLVIESVTQGATTFTKGVDYQLTAGHVDWSLSGAEPNPGTSVLVTYQYQKLTTPNNLTATGFTVDGALPGTLINTKYQYALRRVDRICMDVTGKLVALRGVADRSNPVPPQVPSGLLLLATIHQRWTERRLVHDGTTTVKMEKLVAMDARDALILQQIATLRLAVDVAGRYGGQQFGQFADPLRDSTMRDWGIQQTATIADELLQLPAGINGMLAEGTEVLSLAHTPEAWVVQGLQTGTLNINNSGIASAIPVVTLTPSVDRWTEQRNLFQEFGATNPNAFIDTAWKWNGNSASWDKEAILSEVRERLIAKGYGTAANIRQRDVQASIAGVFLGENIVAVTFGGKPANIKAYSTAGDTAAVTFEIPAGVPEGTVPVTFKGSKGTEAAATYVGDASTEVTLTIRVPGTGKFVSVWAGAKVTL